MENVKAYLVGGAVRDKLLGREPKDLDYVVVGATPEYLLALGFTQVGQAFPVFLHPETGDEYALARKEKKVGAGYTGFEFEFGPHVTLEEDLSRRDLTINSIAMDLETEEIIDPFGGHDDLVLGVIRHTSKAFSEDPLRVLRVARFASRYGFYVDYHTQELCRRVIRSDDFGALSSERIWVEIEKMFSEAHPSLGLEFLSRIGAFNVSSLDFVSDIITQLEPGVEETLNTTEKLFYGINRDTLTNEDCEKFKIPTKVARELRFMDSIDAILMDVYYNAEVKPESFVRAFDTFREEMVQGKLTLMKDLLMKLTRDTPSEEEMVVVDVINKLQAAANELHALDFTNLVKGMKGPEIKQFVFEKKTEIVKKHVQ